MYELIISQIWWFRRIWAGKIGRGWFPLCFRAIFSGKCISVMIRVDIKIIRGRKEVNMARKVNSVRTSRPVASRASKLMQSSKSTAVRKVAASALSNRKKSSR